MRPPLKQCLFPVPRVAEIVASRAATFFFFLGGGGGGGKKIVKTKQNKRGGGEVLSRPLCTHPAASPEITFFTGWPGSKCLFKDVRVFVCLEYLCKGFFSKRFDDKQECHPSYDN